MFIVLHTIEFVNNSTKKVINIFNCLIYNIKRSTNNCYYGVNVQFKTDMISLTYVKFNILTMLLFIILPSYLFFPACGCVDGDFDDLFLVDNIFKQTSRTSKLIVCIQNVEGQPVYHKDTRPDDNTIDISIINNH